MKISQYTLSYTGEEVNNLLATVNDNHSAWDSISQSANHIIAEGTSDEWAWRKYASGMAECWLNKTFSTSTGFVTWGNGYVSDERLAERTYPFEFTDYPIVNATYKNIDSNYEMAVVLSGGTKNTSPVVRGLRTSAMASGTTYTFQVTLHVIGSWK